MTDVFVPVPSRENLCFIYNVKVKKPRTKSKYSLEKIKWKKRKEVKRKNKLGKAGKINWLISQPPI